MRRFARLVVIVGAVLALASSSALAAARVKVYGASVTFAWEPSSGPVDYYAVYTSRNGKGFKKDRAETEVSTTRVTVSGQYGETLRLRVAACTAAGSCSGLSERSAKVKFMDPNDANSGGNNTQGRNAGNGANDWVDLPPPPPPVPLAQGAMPYDFNGDGRTDLLWRNRRTKDVAVWLMDGTPSPGGANLGMLENKWAFVGSGDFDGDGYADLLLRESRRSYEIWFMNGAQIGSVVPLEGPDGGYRTEVIGDFDGDGYADLLWRKGKKSLVWFMRGSTVDEAVDGPVIKKLSPAVCSPDLDGDGRSDVIWSGGQETAAWLMAGSSPWRSGPVGPKMKKYDALGCGDADGDGFGDVLWYSKNPGGILWVMDGNLGVDLSLELPQLEAGWIMEVSGDFNGDGLANEILVRHKKSGAIEIWQLQWNSQRTSFSVASTPGLDAGGKDWEIVAP